MMESLLAHDRAAYLQRLTLTIQQDYDEPLRSLGASWLPALR